jgi:hypothetical protein
MRTELDNDDAVILVQQIREEVRREVERIRVEEGFDLEAWWGLGGGNGSSSLEAKSGNRDREKL